VTDEPVSRTVISTAVFLPAPCDQARDSALLSDENSDVVAVFAIGGLAAARLLSVHASIDFLGRTVDCCCPDKKRVPESWREMGVR
jgi:hypothetical protein